MAPIRCRFDQTAVWHSDAARGPSTPSLDHLVGTGEQRRRDFETKGPGRLQINDKFKLGRLHYGQIDGLGAFEDAARICTDLAMYVPEVGSVTHQAADFSKLARGVDGRNSMARRQGDQLDAPAREQRIGDDQKRGCPLLYHRCKRCVDLAAVARVKHCDLLPDGGHSNLHIPYGQIGGRIPWIAQDDDIGISRYQLPQESEPLWPQLLGKVAHTRRITSGP